MIVQGVAGWLRKGRLSQWAPVVVAVVELVFCADYHERRWDTEVVKCTFPPEHVGEGHVIQANGLGY